MEPKEQPSEPKAPSSPLKKRRIGLPSIIHDPLFGGYDRGYGGLGLPTHLLQFKYKECPHSVQLELDRQLLHRSINVHLYMLHAIVTHCNHSHVKIPAWFFLCPVPFSSIPLPSFLPSLSSTIPSSLPSPPPFLSSLPLFASLPSPPSLPSLRRPYFTYWLMFVHIVIMIISLSVYGFAPYGWDRFTESRTIRQSNLAFETTRRNVIPSVWGGSRQMDLVLLGALYAPCMRIDRQLFGALLNDTQMENTSSGCCVRRDESGCVQVEESDCPVSPFRSSIHYTVKPHLVITSVKQCGQRNSPKIFANYSY